MAGDLESRTGGLVLSGRSRFEPKVYNQTGGLASQKKGPKKNKSNRESTNRNPRLMQKERSRILKALHINPHRQTKVFENIVP